jgi:hypothetical protein
MRLLWWFVNDLFRVAALICVALVALAFLPGNRRDWPVLVMVGLTFAAICGGWSVVRQHLAQRTRGHRGFEVKLTDSVSVAEKKEIDHG